MWAAEKLPLWLAEGRGESEKKEEEKEAVKAQLPLRARQLLNPTKEEKKNSKRLKKKKKNTPPSQVSFAALSHTIPPPSYSLSFFPFVTLPPPPKLPSGPLSRSPCPRLLGLLVRFEDGVVSQDLAQLVEAMLHLGDAGQLRLQPLLLLGQREARRRVQLLEAPAPLAVELQQVGVVLPGGRAKKKHLICGAK